MIFTISMVCCLLAAGLAVPVDQALKFEDDASKELQSADNTRLYFGKEGSMRTAATNIWHMERDLYKDTDYILYAWGSALKTFGYAYYLPLDVVGSIDITGYVEGTGTSARFSTISDFIQIDQDTVVIVDQNNHCLRQLDRKTGRTSRYAGQCTKPGMNDGAAHHAMFNKPSDVLLDERTGKALLVIEETNNAIRSIDMATKQTSTILDKEPNLDRFYYAVFDNNDKNILYMTVIDHILKVSLSDGTTSILTGMDSQVLPIVDADGTFATAKVGYFPSEIIYLDKNHLAFTTYWNHEVKIIDLVDKEVTSVCSPSTNSTYSSKSDCQMLNPSSLLLLNDTLYVGDRATIHTFPVSSLSLNQALSACSSDSIKATINIGDTKARVAVDDDTVLHLAAGTHQYVYTDDMGMPCTMNIIVEDSAAVCPQSISRVADARTKSAVVDLVIGNVFQQFTLPVGVHPYTVKIGEQTCYFNIDIVDADIERRLEFQVDYSFDCADMADAVPSEVIKTTAEHNFAFILEVCKGVCSRKQGGTPTITCSNDVLTVVYPTDLTYGGDVSDIPADIKKTITDRLISKGTMMALVDTSKVPPIIYPVKQANGSSAKLALTTMCLNGKTYDSASDSCQ